MEIEILENKQAVGRAAAVHAAERLRAAIREKGAARFIAATGASQFEFLEALVALPGIDWAKCEMFHLDEYIGLSADHPASFRRYLRERLTGRVPVGKAHWIEGEAPEAEAECRRLGAIILQAPVDAAFVGIGENGHLAFNDPPADFETEQPYIVLKLDEACRRQQLGEGWFGALADVPARAISMSIRQIMKARSIVCTVPDLRKAQAVKDCLGGEVSNLHPASILQRHGDTRVFLDPDSASLLLKTRGLS